MLKKLLLFLTITFISLEMANAQSLKVMSYNIRLDVASDGVNAWPNRPNKVATLITKYDPDILGVQEALFHQLTDLLKLLPEYEYSGVGRDDGKQKGEFSAILYKKKRFQLQEDSTFWLSETPTVSGSKSWDAAITRVASKARLYDKKLKREFIIINTHFDHIGKVARANAATLITKTADNYQKQYPVIVAGDFNSEREELAYQNMIATGLQDSKPDNDNTGTFCGFEVGKIKCNPIDFIFYSKEWTVKKYQVIQDHDGKHYPSDHLPVQTEFSLTRKNKK